MKAGRDDALGSFPSGRDATPRPRLVRRLEMRSPFDGKTIGTAPDFNADALIECFEDALGALHALPNGQLVQEKLRDWARKIHLQREQLARIVSLETGKPIRFARVEVLTALTVLDSRCNGAASPFTRDCGARRLIFLISNWCDPILTMVREVVAAFCSGRALVIKPSSRASLVTLTLASLWNNGDGADALLRVVTSTDALAMLQTAVQSSKVGEVRFRGTREVGAYISRVCLGVKMPVTILAMERVSLVVDVDRVCDVIVNRAFLQPSSVGAERVSCLYVRNSVADLLIPILASRAARLRLGNPLHGVTDIGPVIDDVAVAVTREQVDDAIANGATLLGKDTVCVGRQLRPMILDHVQPSMRVCNEELEGPLLPIIRFSSLTELRTVESGAGNVLT